MLNIDELDTLPVEHEKSHFNYRYYVIMGAITLLLLVVYIGLRWQSSQLEQQLRTHSTKTQPDYAYHNLTHRLAVMVQFNASKQRDRQGWQQIFTLLSALSIDWQTLKLTPTSLLLTSKQTITPVVLKALKNRPCLSIQLAGKRLSITQQLECHRA